MWATILVALLVSDMARPFEGSAPPQTTVASIQIQGNTATSDEEIRRLADVRVGMPFDEGTVDAVERRALPAARRTEPQHALELVLAAHEQARAVVVLIERQIVPA